ncbi:MAG: polyprenyl synthetase family protein [Candidatus Eutrophobiaceae bacterium]
MALPKKLQLLQDLIEPDLQQLDRLIKRRLHSEVPLISQLGNHIAQSGGKRLRPILLLLAAGCFPRPSQYIHELAAVIELIHTATLLHDDVVDDSMLRHGKITANQRWGNEASVLVGDFVYSRAFQIMVESESLQVMKILADATNAIAVGEVRQLAMQKHCQATEKECLDIIYCKTAKLFEAAAQLGAVTGGGTESQIHALSQYGANFGIAYQLIDDVLDYAQADQKWGKGNCTDLRNGKPTLPLLHAMWNARDDNARELISQTIKRGGVDAKVEEIMVIIKDTKTLEYIKSLAEQYAHKAIECLDCLPESRYTEALRQLAEFSVEREY